MKVIFEQLVVFLHQLSINVVIMTWILKLARYNEITASILGLLLNLLLLYVVCTVKSKIGNISRILLQNCFIDMALGIVTLLAGVHTVSINNIYYVFLGSWLHVYGFECASYLISFYCIFVILSIQALPIPFYVRYQILCKGKVVTVKQFLVLYCIVFIVSIITFATAIFCYPPNEKFYEPLKAATMTEFWLDEFPKGPVFVARRTEDKEMLAFIGFAFFTASVGYCLVLFFSIQITRHLRNHVSSFQHTKIHSKQLHWTLIAQAIGPIIVGNCPIFVLIVMIFFGIENNYTSVAFSSLIGYVGVVNPLAALIIMSPYRKKVAQILRIHSTSTSSSQNSGIPQSILPASTSFFGSKTNTVITN